MSPRDDNNLKVLPPSASSSFLSTLSEGGGDDEESVTIIGFGSLLSEKSSRLTFPNLTNFRLGRVNNYRRVFGHPTSIFFRRGIANKETLEMSSLAVEPADGHSFLASVFQVPKAEMMEGSEPGRAFLEREEEFDIVRAPFVFVDSNMESTGIICTRSTDEEFVRKWGQGRFDEHYRKYGIKSIWTWQPDSGLRPCGVYLRHCVLASMSLGRDCYDSFLDDTYLVDRRTTVREYLAKYPHILELEPPADLADRYSG
jgi:hypothetical protein